MCNLQQIVKLMFKFVSSTLHVTFISKLKIHDVIQLQTQHTILENKLIQSLNKLIQSFYSTKKIQKQLDSNHKVLAMIKSN